MRIYIASSLHNALVVQRLRDYLAVRGHSVTYDWTQHGQVRGTADDLRQIAMNEIHLGVQRADVVVVLLPGRKGTHTELGAAIAYGKKIILCSDDPNDFDTDSPTTTMAYHHPAIVEKLTSPDPLHILAALERLGIEEAKSEAVELC